MFSRPTAPTLTALLSHPVCVELVKAQLHAIHSVENLQFYLHVQRYRQLTRSHTRRTLAIFIFDEFIRSGAAQEINIGTRQREAITAAVAKKGDEGASVDLFKEAEKEVLMLMETNVVKAFQGSDMQRLCSWVLATMPVRLLSGGSGASGYSSATHRPHADVQRAVYIAMECRGTEGDWRHNVDFV